MPPTRLTGRDTSRPRSTPKTAADPQRRRREVALTATWLRELRGLTGGGPTSGRFTRST